MTRLRRIALGVMAHASRVFPNVRSAWREGMQQEMAHIESDRVALVWALGCFLVSYRERVGTMTWLQRPAARALLAVPVFFLALNEFFAPVLTLAYTLHDRQLLGLMGARTPGDDYRRFIPLMDATPFWLHAFWLASGVAFVFSVWALLRDRRSAFGFFVAGLALELIAGVASVLLKHFVPAYHDAALAASTFAAPNVRRDILVPLGQYIFMALVGAALWLAAGRTSKQT